MAKRKRSDSGDTDSLVFIYSTRSSARKSMDPSTIATKDRLARETNTPTTEDTVDSTDFQNSPSSSRTSSNINEAVSTLISTSGVTKRPLNIKGTNKFQNEDASVSPVTSKAPTNDTPDRPERRWKPTQKAVELAANSSSKLFKSIGKTRIEADDASYTEELRRSVSEHVASDDEAIEAAPTSRKNIRQLPGRSSRKKKPMSEPTAETEDELASEVMNPELSPSSLRSRRSQYSKEPLDSEEAPVARPKPITTRKLRSKNQKPAEETLSTSLNLRSPDKSSKATSDPTRSCIAVLKVKVRNDLPNPESQELAPSSRTSDLAQTKPEPKHPPQKKTGQTDITTSTSTSKSSSTSPTQPTPTILPSSKPTRSKFKPLQATTSPARDGYTSLPCNLSCLTDSDLFYMWAKISIEHEDLAEELCALTSDDYGGESFAKDKTEEARKVRGRLNVLMAGFCECGKSGAVKGVRKEIG